MHCTTCLVVYTGPSLARSCFPTSKLARLFLRLLRTMLDALLRLQQRILQALFGARACLGRALLDLLLLLGAPVEPARARGSSSALGLLCLVGRRLRGVLRGPLHPRGGLLGRLAQRVQVTLDELLLALGTTTNASRVLLERFLGRVVGRGGVGLGRIDGVGDGAFGVASSVGSLAGGLVGLGLTPVGPAAGLWTRRNVSADVRRR